MKNLRLKTLLVLLLFTFVGSNVLNGNYNNKVQAASEISVVEDGKNGWEKVNSKDFEKDLTSYSEQGTSNTELPNRSARAIATTKYDVFNAYGVKLYANVGSLFNAISLSSTYGSYVKENDGNNIKVFEKNDSSNTFFCFQSTNYYKTTTNINEAKSWVNNYSSTHVYDGTGKLRFNSYKSIKGIPDSFALEPESGGYFYKYSSPALGYKSSYTNIKLSNAKLKFPTTSGKKTNAYIFKSIVNSKQTIEFGVVATPQLYGKWVLFCRDNSGFYLNRDVVVSNSTVNNGEYTPKENFELTISLSDGAVLGTIRNTSGTVYQTYKLPASSVYTNTTPFFLDAVSFLPDDKDITGDLRNGAYLKNVYLNSSKVYSGLNKTGYAYDFFANSPSTTFSFIYNDDVASYTRSYNDEIININYDQPYKK